MLFCESLHLLHVGLFIIVSVLYQYIPLLSSSRGLIFRANCQINFIAREVFLLLFLIYFFNFMLITFI